MEYFYNNIPLDFYLWVECLTMQGAYIIWTIVTMRIYVMLICQPILNFGQGLDFFWEIFFVQHCGHQQLYKAFRFAFPRHLMILLEVQLSAEFCNDHGTGSATSAALHQAYVKSWNFSGHIFEVPLEFEIKLPSKPPDGIIKSSLCNLFLTSIFVCIMLVTIWRMLRLSLDTCSDLKCPHQTCGNSSHPSSRSCFATFQILEILRQAFSAEYQSKDVMVHFDSNSTSYVVDNSANCHICSQKELYVGKVTALTGDTGHVGVQTATGVLVPRGLGTVHLKIKDDEGIVHTKDIHDALFFPESPVNILRVTHLADQLKDDEGTSVHTKQKYSIFIICFTVQRSIQLYTPLMCKSASIQENKNG